MKLINILNNDPDLLAQTKKVSDFLIQLIKEHQNKISFARFMQEVLYAPGIGYYSAGSHKFGAHGDFVTAPEISTLFSYCLAKQCAEVLPNLSQPYILEFGAGSGKMAKDILVKLEQLNSLPKKYYIIEISPDLKQRQQQFLQQEISHLFTRVEWLSALPKNFCGIILANEIIDAMPVNLFTWQNDSLLERFVTTTQDGLQLIDATPETEVAYYFQQEMIKEIDVSQWPQPYHSEINLWAPAWLKSIADVLQEGVILLIDYGYPRREYYHSQRDNGTLMCHFQHHAHSDPFFALGLQDITAHVDFTQIAKVGHRLGWQLEGYTTQAHFLQNLGITLFLEDNTLSDIERYQLTQQVKKLTMPNQMGETFKVIGFSKNYSPAILTGFSQGDMSFRLG